jgi:hypothetical protein
MTPLDIYVPAPHPDVNNVIQRGSRIVGAIDPRR